MEEKERDRERIEKENLERLKERKKKVLQQESIEQEEEEDLLPLTEEYERTFEFLKRQESIATQELYFQNSNEDDVVIKRK